MWTQFCVFTLLAAAPPVLELRLGQPTGKSVTPLLFGVNAEFFRPGLADGVRSRRREFAAALQGSGVGAIRFPGGNAAYYYLPESRELTLELAHKAGHWEFRENAPPNNRFTRLEDLAAFATEARVRLIYQLPCLFYLDGDRPRALIRSKLSEKAGNYDRDRVAEGVAWGLAIVKRLRALKAPIAAWEVGNEEFALCSPRDYARVAMAYLRALKRIDPGTPVFLVGMGKEWLPGLVPPLRRARVLDAVSAFQVHYPFGNWPGPGSPDRRGNPAALAAGDLKIEKYLRAAVEGRRKLGIQAKQIAVTETMVLRHRLWNPAVVVPTFGHALCYAWNWLALIESPPVPVAVFHDLETPFFGMLRYDVGFDAERKRFVWLEAARGTARLDPVFPREYVLSPTGYANRLLAGLSGGALLRTNIPTTPDFRLAATRDCVVAVNRGATPRRLGVPFQQATAESLVADGLDACLPGQYRYRTPAPIIGSGTLAKPQTPRSARLVFELPAYSVTRVRLVSHPIPVAP